MVSTTVSQDFEGGGGDKTGFCGMSDKRSSNGV